jgi:hypothetical protein
MTPAGVARELWSLVEPIHAVTYFAPEPLAELASAGYRGFWMGYFAGRAAPLGPVGADVVHAIFYNFSFARVARAVPAAWAFAPPQEALAARLRGSAAALRRSVGPALESMPLEDLADLAGRAVMHLTPEGRPLFAANRALAQPEEPLERLWHATTLLREHRGDGHTAALVAAGIGGRESHVLHALYAGTPRETYTVARDFDDREWAECLRSLQDRGLVADGALIAAGQRLKAEIEERTNALAGTGLDRFSPGEAGDLIGLLRPITEAVVAAGDIPLDSPMGLNLRNLLR